MLSNMPSSCMKPDERCRLPRCDNRPGTFRSGSVEDRTTGCVAAADCSVAATVFTSLAIPPQTIHSHYSTALGPDAMGWARSRPCLGDCRSEDAHRRQIRHRTRLLSLACATSDERNVAGNPRLSTARDTSCPLQSYRGDSW
jgi:hypothetical protein